MEEKEYTCEDCCEFINLNTYCPLQGDFIDDNHKAICRYFCQKPKPTVFDKITASEEALADSVVMPIIVEYSGDILWVSPLLQKDASKRAIFFDSKEEAVAATVEELKNEVKDE